MSSTAATLLQNFGGALLSHVALYTSPDHRHEFQRHGSRVVSLKANDTMSASAGTKEKVEELKRNTEIQQALDQTALPEPAVNVPSKRQHKFFLTTYLLEEEIGEATLEPVRTFRSLLSVNAGRST